MGNSSGEDDGMAQRVQLHSENNDFQRIEVLKRNRQKRHAYREFFVEGVRNLTQAVARGWKIRSLFYARDAQLSQWAQELLQRSGAETHFECAPALMGKLSEKDETSEMCAAVEMPPDDLTRIPHSNNAPFRAVVVDRPSNPGNLGTLLRSCDAFGVNGVIVTGHAVDLYEPAVVRASMGSFFAVPTVRLPSHKELTPWLAALREEHPGLRVIATSAKAEHRLRQADLGAHSVVLLGNETDGLSAAYRELSDVLVKIPMTGTASSLNVSCAASIVLYELSQRVPFTPSGA